MMLLHVNNNSFQFLLPTLNLHFNNNKKIGKIRNRNSRRKKISKKCVFMREIKLIK